MSRRGAMCGGDVGIFTDFGIVDENGRVRCPACEKRVKLRKSPIVAGRYQIPVHKPVTGVTERS